MKKQRTLAEAIDNILDSEISIDVDDCGCDSGCCGGYGYLEGRTEALYAIEALLKKNGIDPKQLVK